MAAIPNLEHSKPGSGDQRSDPHATDGASLTSSIFGYTYENGRRYHAYREGSYLLPNDAEEQDRLDLQHHIYRLQLGGALHLAPLRSNIKRVLDFGTGMVRLPPDSIMARRSCSSHRNWHLGHRFRRSICEYGGIWH